MAAFTSLRTDDQTLNDFVLAVLKDIDRGEPEDVITPLNPFFRRMMQNNDGMLERRAPGRGPVEDVMFQTQDRGITLSRDKDLQQRNLTPVEGYTEAQYDWVMLLESLTLPFFEMKNAQGERAIVDYVKRKKRLVDTAMKVRQNDIMWNGITAGTQRVFGLSEFMQTDTSIKSTKRRIPGGKTRPRTTTPRTKWSTRATRRRTSPTIPPAIRCSRSGGWSRISTTAISPKVCLISCRATTR